MSENQGALFNIIISVIIVGIIIAAMAIFMPGAMQDITSGSKELITNGFTKAKTSANDTSVTY